jgi:hypothetical protein
MEFQYLDTKWNSNGTPLPGKYRYGKYGKYGKVRYGTVVLFQYGTVPVRYRTGILNTGIAILEDAKRIK